MYELNPELLEIEIGTTEQFLLIVCLIMISGKYLLLRHGKIVLVSYPECMDFSGFCI
jgi:hypothetical protein